MNVGILVRVEIRHPVDDGLRFLSGRGVVQPDEPAAVDPFIQDREFAADRVGIKARLPQRLVQRRRHGRDFLGLHQRYVGG